MKDDRKRSVNVGNKEQYRRIDLANSPFLSCQNMLCRGQNKTYVSKFQSKVSINYNAY